MIKLTKETINERIASRGFILIGDYINASTKTAFQCALGHIWIAKYLNIHGGKGCSQCYTLNNKLSKEIVNQRISDRELKLLDEYVDTTHKSRFRCSNDHEWIAKISTVLSGHGCPRCSKNKLSKEIVNERIKHREIELIDDYVDNKTKSKFRCNENHEWLSSPANILKGAGCPKCANTGFNPSKPAHVYILKFENFIKYGISNNITSRIKTHRTKNGNFEIITTKLFENGNSALEWENDVKKKFGGKYATKEQCPDGYTETLPLNVLTLLIETLQKLHYASSDSRVNASVTDIKSRSSCSTSHDSPLKK